MEEANAPRGWEDEEELDYTIVSQRQAMNTPPGASTEHKLVAGKQLNNTLSLLKVEKQATISSFSDITRQLLRKQSFI